MARVLLCFSSHLFVGKKFRLVSYYEGLIKELEKNNNQVMVCNCAEFLNKSWNSPNKETSFLNIQKFLNEIRGFDPEVVISFNNVKPSFIEDICSCPIVIWEADSFSFFNDKEIILKNPNRYTYFCLSTNVKEQLKDVGVFESNIHLINSGTAICKDDSDFKTNVSFIGSNFKGPQSLSKLLKEHNNYKVKDAIKYLADNFYVDPEVYLNDKGLSYVLDYMAPEEFGMINSCQNRIDTLNSMTKFGLELFGSANWIDSVEYSPQLALAFNPKPVFSLQHNQDIYNSSRLCLNVSHAQAVDGFSWRIMDIMASNGCLLTNYNSGIKKFTKGYVDLPMYRSSGEAESIARKLLKDEVYRSELVEASQACIDEKGRWIHRFKEITDATGIDLANSSDVGSITYLSRDGFINPLFYTYSLMVALAARSTPKITHKFLYALAVKLGFNVDYQLIKSVMEQDR